MTTHASETVDTAPGPRRVALISDVHGNLPALEAVLADVDASSADAIWCLGDVVGYGAQPSECIALVREHAAVCLAGNHDLVVTGEIDISVFASHAAVAAEWTRTVLEPEELEWLSGLSPAEPDRRPALFHASPRDPVWEYVLSMPTAEACLDAMQERVGAVGHSHMALWFHHDGDGMDVCAPAPAGTTASLGEGRWLINPGSVGQPRDGDARAAWLLLDRGDWAAEWRRVDYPIDEAAGAIERAGLPPFLANRLYYGQ